jgi:hypothetical protein
MRGQAKVVLTLATIAGALAGTSSPADAGLLQSWPVSIDQANRVAQGSLGSARNTTDSIQYIGCWNTVQGYNDVPPPAGDIVKSGGCYAVDSANRSATCVLPAGGLAPMTPPMTPESFIVFTWDASGICTGIQIWAYSSYSPKKL